MYESMWTRRFPEQFGRLDDEARFGVSQALASGHLEGWEPTVGEVTNLVDLELGVISGEEYERRAAAARPAASAAG